MQHVSATAGGETELICASDMFRWYGSARAARPESDRRVGGLWIYAQYLGGGSILINLYGTPTIGQIFLYIGGSLVAFALLAIIAFPYLFAERETAQSRSSSSPLRSTSSQRSAASV